MSGNGSTGSRTGVRHTWPLVSSAYYWRETSIPVGWWGKNWFSRGKWETLSREWPVSELHGFVCTSSHCLRRRRLATFVSSRHTQLLSQMNVESSQISAGTHLWHLFWVPIIHSDFRFETKRVASLLYRLWTECFNAVLLSFSLCIESRHHQTIYQASKLCLSRMTASPLK